MSEWIEILSKVDIQKLILNFCISFYFSVAGILVTLFTVIHSFIESKQSIVNSYENAIRFNNANAIDKSELKFGKTYIKRYKRLNKVILFLLLLSFVMLLPLLLCLVFQWHTPFFYFVTCIGLIFFLLLLLFTLCNYIDSYFVNVYDNHAFKLLKRFALYHFSRLLNKLKSTKVH